MSAIPIIDLAMARRLERVEGMANAACVAARAELQPEIGATWIEVAGVMAMFDGPTSPLTQTFGLGLARLPSDAELDEVEGFFTSRGAAVDHEICPLVDPEFLRSLPDRGYRPIEWSDVMLRTLDPAEEFPEFTFPDLSVRLIEPRERESWARLAARGWSQDPQFANFMFDLSRVVAARSGSLCFIAELNQRPIATSGLFVHDRVALLAGACTIPEARRQGAQRALFAARLQHAAQIGCELALVVTLPGSSSHRNAQVSQFETVYTRTKWRRT
jgi:GNAT superfamily N-acetyltransferase